MTLSDSCVTDVAIAPTGKRQGAHDPVISNPFRNRRIPLPAAGSQWQQMGKVSRNAWRRKPGVLAGSPVRLFWPQSIFGLILTGYALALLPLAVALGMTVILMENVADRSQTTIIQVVKAVEGARVLISQLTDMERNARQYLVLREDKLLAAYKETHEVFRQTLAQLKAWPWQTPLRQTLRELDQTEQALFQVFGVPRDTPRVAEIEVVEFQQAQELAKTFFRQSTDWRDREIARIQTLINDTSLTLRALMAAVITSVLILAGIFAVLIRRPLSRMAKAIQQLGQEDFKRPIAIRGPRDLEKLGERLDWLRVRLAELDEQKARFLRHMSHELKTPLTALREGTELLTDQVVGPLTAEQQEVVTILRENSVQLQRLIQDLLDFNQALSRTLHLQIEPLSLDQLVNEVIDNQRLVWKAREIELKIRLDSLWISGDREKLKTIVDNVLSNAIKFSPAKSTIRIRLRAVDGTAQLDVHDAGPGFHPADRAHVFEAFYQGRTVAKGHVQGSGLGLAIAREYAMAHRGRLEIADDISRGACVRFTLPLTRSAR